MYPTKVDASRAITWLSEGWKVFKLNPGAWIVMTTLLFIASVLLNLIPLLGSLIMMLLTPALMGGFYFAVNEALRDRPIEISQLVIGLADETQRSPLLVLGAIFVGVCIGATLILSLVIGSSVGIGLFTGALSQRHELAALGALGAGLTMTMLIIMAVGVIVGSMMIYAVPLVMFDSIQPGEAVKRSVRACLGNILPLTVFGVFYFLLSIVAAIPFGLGFLVLVPVTMIALMISFRDIFPDSQSVIVKIEHDNSAST